MLALHNCDLSEAALLVVDLPQFQAVLGEGVHVALVVWVQGEAAAVGGFEEVAHKKLILPQLPDYEKRGVVLRVQKHAGA